MMMMIVLTLLAGLGGVTAGFGVVLILYGVYCWWRARTLEASD